MPEGIDLEALLRELQAAYAGRGVNLRRIDDRWAFRTAEDLAFVLKREVVEQKKLSRAAVETLADHRLPPAGDARRDRGGARRRGLAGHARRAAGGGLGAAARPAAHAGPAGHLRHDAGIPRPFRAGIDRRPAGPRRPAGGGADRHARQCRPTRRRSRTTAPSFATTRIRSSWISPISAQRLTRTPDDADEPRTATTSPTGTERRGRRRPRLTAGRNGLPPAPRRLISPAHGSHALAPKSRRRAAATIASRLTLEKVTRRFGRVDGAARTSTSTCSPARSSRCSAIPAAARPRFSGSPPASTFRRSGRVLVDGREVASPNVFVPPEKRSIGLMFQDYALFPHLTVLRNVMFGLTALDRKARERGGARRARARRPRASGGILSARDFRRRAAARGACPRHRAAARACS